MLIMIAQKLKQKQKIKKFQKMLIINKIEKIRNGYKEEIDTQERKHLKN